VQDNAAINVLESAAVYEFNELEKVVEAIDDISIQVVPFGPVAAFPFSANHSISYSSGSVPLTLSVYSTPGLVSSSTFPSQISWQPIGYQFTSALFRTVPGSDPANGLQDFDSPLLLDVLSSLNTLHNDNTNVYSQLLVITTYLSTLVGSIAPILANLSAIANSTDVAANINYNMLQNLEFITNNITYVANNMSYVSNNLSYKFPTEVNYDGDLLRSTEPITLAEIVGRALYFTTPLAFADTINLIQAPIVATAYTHGSRPYSAPCTSLPCFPSRSLTMLDGLTSVLPLVAPLNITSSDLVRGFSIEDYAESDFGLFNLVYPSITGIPCSLGDTCYPGTSRTLQAEILFVT